MVILEANTIKQEMKEKIRESENDGKTSRNQAL